ncbi:MAG: Ig domain-containing protein [Eubacteriales bacterium]|nr:Ig domain-containing protein [Eubacteriales bacterium]
MKKNRRFMAALFMLMLLLLVSSLFEAKAFSTDIQNTDIVQPQPEYSTPKEDFSSGISDSGMEEELFSTTEEKSGISTAEEFSDGVLDEQAEFFSGEEDGIEAFSMQPLTEVKAYLAFNNVPADKIKAMPVSELVQALQDKDGNKIEISPAAVSLWINFKMDEDNIDKYDHYSINSEETVDLSEASNVIGYRFEMIVGSGNQLNSENIRYIVKVYTGYPEEFSFELYSQGIDSTRQKIEPKRMQFLLSDSNIYDPSGKQIPVWNYACFLDEGDYANLYLGVTSQLEEHPDVSVKIYETSDYLKNGWSAAELTSRVLDPDMKQKNAGYRMTDNEASFIVLYYINGVQVDVLVLDYLITGNVSEIKGDLLTDHNSIKKSVVKYTNVSFSMGSDSSETYEYVLNAGYSANEEYFLTLNAISGSNGNVNNLVKKAVVGFYDSISAAESRLDIKNLLFSEEGYKANYGGDGVKFTLFFQAPNIFDSGYKYQFTVKAKSDTDVTWDYSDAPVIGSKDPWFRVTGASSNGKLLNTYVVENGKSINMDTMYGYGYQAVLIYDTVTKIQPTFWLADSDTAKVTSIFTDNGKRFKIGDTISCSSDETTVTFHVTIEDSNGKHTKNYVVSFIKKSNGPRLYVAGPKGKAVRSVFLDEYFEYKHDIFIANTGNKELSGLRVKLNAANVKLDDYWTLGGKNADTLAPFTTTQASGSEYGELPNIAKIRLLPDGEGAIKGTLTIYADGIEPITIKLIGQAQNPKITTKGIGNAVKYVPYSYLVTTNNMYDWNKVKFSIVSGKLPKGVKLYPTTGEIYGVPQETGTYKIRIKASYSQSKYFAPSYANLTLKVKSNTNSNVYNASDSGYKLLNAIGKDQGNNHDYVITKYQDYVLRSSGKLEEFVNLWLNGKKLIKGVDYISENGSTKITVRSQTFKNKSKKTGTNTIAAEFRTKGTISSKKLKRTAQNYRIKIKKSK